MDTDSDVYAVSDANASDFAFTPPAAKKKKVVNGTAKATTTTKKATTAAAPKKKPLAPRRSNSAVMSEDDGDFDPKPSAKAGGSKTKTATETYQKLTQLEHILKRPDTYIGSIEKQSAQLWVFDKNTKMMAFRKTEYVPGFYKIFDEILVNAADNKVRDLSMTWIKVTIDREEGSISIENNGRGIPIEVHEKEQVWIPELIFGHLLTSSNYDDDEDKVTGGRNGYGAKLANIYSTEFTVETGNKDIEKKYKQTFSANMQKLGKPSITKGKTDFTKITFKPDFAKFGMEGIDDDTEALLMKRVYDMAGTVKDCSVHLNGEKIKISSFKAYVEMYVKAINELTGAKPEDDDVGLVLGQPSGDKKPSIIYEAYTNKGKTWEVAFVCSADGIYRQVSFVNNIATIKGGKHVEMVEHQIISKIIEHLSKNKKSGTIKPAQVRNYCWIFVNCQIVNPSFDSQTKEEMTLKPSAFGSKWALSDTMEKKILKSGVLDHVLSFAKFKQEQELKKTDGAKRKRITGIPKLEDANNAGSGRKSRECTLILTEGDSAKALAVSGLTEVGRDNYGVFPLRGKLLNVREAGHDQIMKNVEISHINKILGLKHGQVYENVDSLRYGSLMIMTDQDHDGSHIKGLIINFLDTFYPSLLKLPDFLVEFITPIVKATKGKQELAFFTIPEYEKWKENNNNGAGWKIKYYKGLGTSESSDIKKYFRAMNKHMLPFQTTQTGDRELIDLAFNKKKADDRKEWLRQFEPGTYLDHNIDKVPISDFINKELILFSMADNLRSIPSLVDGLKPGQRKILYACFKRKLNPKIEIKVAQLGGYVSEHTAYHHGENNLAMTIVGLAQNFVGSNNINLLAPRGQFGTRALGGKDAAAARYIFTTIPEHTRHLFHPADDALLNYLNEEGQDIEPEWYLPILPMVLVNGSEGIGTGWSSQVPNYNPLDIIANLRRRLRGEDPVPMHPWYRGFKGAIELEAPGAARYKIGGIIRQPNPEDGKTWEIVELPVQTWTTSYKEFLEGMVAGTDKVPATIKDYKEYHTDTTVDFIVELNQKGEEEIKAKGPEVFFKLSSFKTTSNMVLFDADGKIKKYSSSLEILEDFYLLRMSFYQKRKNHLVEALKEAYDRLSNQARFVKMIIDKELSVSNRKRADIVAELRKKNFRPFPKQAKAAVAADIDANPDEAEEVSSDNDFDYLLSMAIYNLTKEKVDRLLAQRDEKEKDLNLLLSRTPESLWEEDLEAFEAQWSAMLEDDETVRKDAQKIRKGKAPVKRAPKAAAAARKVLKGSDDELMIDSEDDFKPSTSKKPAKPRAAVPSKASGTKRAASALDDDDLEIIAGAKTANPGLSKPGSSSKKPKPFSLDEEDDLYAKPSKAATGSTSRKPSAASTSRAKASILDDDDKDEDIILGDLPKREKSSRAAKPSAKTTYIDVDSDDE